MKQRGAGVLIHISSLPSGFGIGDLGPGAYAFVDFLAESGLHYWQVLPLHPTSPRYDNNPYRSLSAFGLNPLFISPELLVRDGYLSPEEIAPPPGLDPVAVDYPAIIAYKNHLFDLAYDRFKREPDSLFRKFCTDNAWWLEPFALFFAIRDFCDDTPWETWPDGIKTHVPEETNRMQKELSGLIEKEQFLQYILSSQWNALREYCRENDVLIIGDLPIYIDYDSVDVWMHPAMFHLDASLQPVTVSGVPPDYFSSTGQLWGNPVYNWEYLRQTKYSWWIRRVERNLSLVDILRIDHFRGLVAYWAIPYGEENAINGEWKDVPVEDFLDHLMFRIPSLPIIAEDLGIITPDVREIMRKYEIPGMNVLQFAFSEDIGKNPYIFHNLEKNGVLYTGTHDNPPIIGWFRDNLNEEERERIFSYLGGEIAEADLPWTLIRYALMSVADMVILPIQDILCLGSESRMNNPGVGKNNWRWRAPADYARPEIIERLQTMIRLYGRR